jgi:NAD(P)H-hydrate epimerase
VKSKFSANRNPNTSVKPATMVAMNVLSAEEMQACDRATAEEYGIPPLDLMRAAAAAVSGFAREQFPRARRVTVLCGRGNNGGDGMMAARLLAAAGLQVTTLLLGSPEGLAGDAAEAWRELAHPGSRAAHGLFHIVVTAQDLDLYKDALAADLIVDAVLGTGFKPPLKGLLLAALEWLKQSQAPVLAVDLPSGWGADEIAASAAGPAFPADAVITFTAPKPAHVFGALTRRWDQPIVVAPIGSPEGVIVSATGLAWAGSALELTQSPRAAAANKGKFGHVLVVGGAVGRSGAAGMAALAALRAGAGLVTAAVPAPVLPQVASVALELMTWPLKTTAAGQIAEANLAPDLLEAMTAGKTVLAIGPGLGQDAETVEFAIGLLAATRMPVVIDADALNILAAHPALLEKLGKAAEQGRTLVLTPHPGEMARLAGITVAEVQANRLETACTYAERTGFTLVLKGARTLIAYPDGRVAVNTSGNPGMAKGGSGDVLTGLIAGMLAQYPPEPDSREPARAVEAAVYLHGLAADLAVRQLDQHTLLATDSLAQLSQAFRFRSRGKNGYVWLQGLPAESSPAAASHEAAE